MKIKEYDGNYILLYPNEEENKERFKINAESFHKIMDNKNPKVIICEVYMSEEKICEVYYNSVERAHVFIETTGLKNVDHYIIDSYDYFIEYLDEIERFKEKRRQLSHAIKSLKSQMKIKK